MHVLKENEVWRLYQFEKSFKIQLEYPEPPTLKDFVKINCQLVTTRSLINEKNIYSWNEKYIVTMVTNT